jgi:hypothetical protein
MSSPIVNPLYHLSLPLSRCDLSPQLKTPRMQFLLPYSLIAVNDAASSVSTSGSSKSSSGPPVKSSEWELSYAGFVRYCVASVLKRSNKIIKSGLKLKSKTFAHSTDRLKELLEFREHYLSINEKVEGGGVGTAYSTTAAEKADPKTGAFRSNFLRLVPGFIKHNSFATIVFSSYETLHDDLYNEHLHHRFIHSAFSTPLFGSFACGAGAGLFGGLFYVSWNKTASFMNSSQSNPHSSSLVPHAYVSIPRVLLFHTVVQSSLFTSYELFKSLLQRSVFHSEMTSFCNKNLPSYLSFDHDTASSSSHSHFSVFTRQFSSSPVSLTADLLSISLCGGLAGAVAECLQHSLKVLELRSLPDAHSQLRELLNQQTTVLQRLRFWKHLLFPSFASLLITSLPMSLAFLAYEYGREM